MGETRSERSASEADRSAGEPVLKTLRQLGMQIGPIRMVVTVIVIILAVGIARYSPSLPLLGDAEKAYYDLRFSLFAKPAAQDERIAMVVYTDETLRETGQRSPVDRTILTQALANLDKMGARAIGIDILFDQPQPDDEALIEQLKAMKTPVLVGYTNVSSNSEDIRYEQQQFLDAFLKQVVTPRVQPASIRLETDQDDVIRRWPLRPEGMPPLLTMQMAKYGQDRAGDKTAGANSALLERFTDYKGEIRFRMPLHIDRPVFAKFPIDLLADPDTADLLADEIRGRYILLGGDFVDFDQFDTPLTRIGDNSGEHRKMIGLEVHAHMLAQMLDNDRPGQVPGWLLSVIAILVVMGAAFTALGKLRNIMAMTLLFLQISAFILTPLIMEAIGLDTLALPSFGWASGWLVSYAVTSSAVRTIGARQRNFAQSALGKYLPPGVAGEIIRDPEKLALHGEKRPIYSLFSDMEGFTQLSHSLAPEDTARLLNAYLDQLSTVILRYEGTLDKFVGDAVVAFWGAPIAREDDARRAAEAAWAVYQAGEEFRKQAGNIVPGVSVGRTRVGLHYGDAIVGNFGGEGRIQYTALGDTINTAARLESANKKLGTRVLVSREAAERSGLDWYRPMGRVCLRGRETPVELFEPAPECKEAERLAIGKLLKAHESGDEKSVSDFTAQLDHLCHQPAIENLILRLSQTKGGESYDLG